MYKLPVFEKIKSRLLEPRQFIQVVMGPRQVGKSTVVRQVLEEINIPFKFFAADFVPASNYNWIMECWETARVLSSGSQFLLVIDEIQKIENWSEIVKKLWDEDTFHHRHIKVVLLGSSRILLKKGLSESLAGRYEEIRMGQWDYSDMKKAFGVSLDEYIFYGGYPGAASLIKDPQRFEHYIESSIIEATINKDILQDSKIAKPALLRQTFELACAYSGKILSFTKLIGQLQDAGNTTTVSHYLHLLNESGMVGALQKYSVDIARAKGTIPKYQVYDNSLKNVYLPYSFPEVKEKKEVWGVIFESAIGAHIMNQAFLHRIEVFYWREKDLEVDFILRRKGRIVALEVKSNMEGVTNGLEEFRKRFKPYKALVVRQNGLSVEEFLSLDFLSLFK